MPLRLSRPQLLLAVLTLATVIGSGRALAHPTDQSGGGVHEHDGLYLRFLVGMGATTMSARGEDPELRISGAGLGLSFALGGTVARNLVLFGELVGSTAIEPELRSGDSVRRTPPDTTAGIFGLGLGLGYYLPHNLYLTGTFALSRVEIDLAGDDQPERAARSRFGPGLSLVFGKEWWVSRNWGLGVAAQLYLARMKDLQGDAGTVAPTWRARGVNLMFSATFN